MPASPGEADALRRLAHEGTTESRLKRDILPQPDDTTCGSIVRRKNGVAIGAKQMLRAGARLRAAIARIQFITDGPPWHCQE